MTRWLSQEAVGAGRKASVPIGDGSRQSRAAGNSGAHPPVLMVGNFLSASYGSRGVCEDLAARLSATGWSVITTSRQVSRWPRLFDMVSTAWCRRREYAVAQVDLFSGAAFVWAEVVCRVLQGARKPFVLTLHGGNLPEFARRHPVRARRLLASAAAVTTPSRYLMEQMQPYGEELLLLPNPLQVSAYPFRHRIQPQPRLAWLRTFHQIYNPSLAPQVVARLAAEFPETHLTMVGPDKGDGSLRLTRELAERWGVADRIHFVGGVKKAEVPGWLSRADIFLNTTNVDNTPVSVLEAMACGLCVVSTNVGGIPYLVDNQEDALLVPPDDADAMAAAVRRLLTQPEMAAGLSWRARRKAERCDWSTILPQWDKVLTSAVAKQRE